MKVNYSGDLVQKARALVADKVVPAWPGVGKAASLKLVDFLRGELLDDVLDPARVLLPQAQWPETPNTGRVHATDDEWHAIAKAGLEHGLFACVRDQDVFRDAA